MGECENTSALQPQGPPGGEMPGEEAAPIHIISTTAGVVTFCVLRKVLSLPVSRVSPVMARSRTQYT
jgi:hypothetical protein